MSLRVQITNILAAQNHPNPDGWLLNHHIQTIGEADGPVERLWVNRYWREVLAAMPMNTITFRFLLDDDNSDAEYLESFNLFIAPVLVKAAKEKESTNG